MLKLLIEVLTLMHSAIPYLRHPRDALPKLSFHRTNLLDTLSFRYFGFGGIAKQEVSNHGVSKQRVTLRPFAKLF